MYLSPFSSFNFSKNRCSTDLSATPSRRQKTKAPCCTAVMSCVDAMRASTHNFQRRYSRGSRFSPLSRRLFPNPVDVSEAMATATSGHCCQSPDVPRQTTPDALPLAGLRYQLENTGPLAPRRSCVHPGGGSHLFSPEHESRHGHCFHTCIHKQAPSPSTNMYKM